MSRIKHYTNWMVLAGMLALSGCAALSGKQDPADREGVLLFFNEKQPEKEVQRIRIFVSKNYVHISNVADDSRYQLYRRAEQTLYDVDLNEKSTRVIKGVRKPDLEGDILLEESSAASQLLEGEKTTHYRISVNGEPCYNVVSIEDMLPDTVAALKEISSVRANDSVLGEQLKHGSCEHAMRIHAPTQSLEHGFPVRQWSNYGYQLFLVEFTENIRLADDLVLNKLPRW